MVLGKVVTEIQALALLAGVRTTHVGSGGVAGSEGAVVLSIEGEELSLRTQSNKKYSFRFLNEGDGAKVRRLAAGHIPITE